MSKFKIKIECFTSRHRNTLRGFAMIKVEELHLLVHDVAIHVKDGVTWAQLPMRPPAMTASPNISRSSNSPTRRRATRSAPPWSRRCSSTTRMLWPVGE
jgi:hypothetical protein